MTTTIQLSEETRANLARFKSSPRETYDDVLRKLMALVPTGDDEGEYTDAFRASLMEARLDILAGRTAALSDVKKRLGL